MISSLDDFKEESWSVFEWPRKELKEVAFVIVVNEDLVLLQNVNVLLDFESTFG